MKKCAVVAMYDSTTQVVTVRLSSSLRLESARFQADVLRDVREKVETLYDKSRTKLYKVITEG